MAPPGAIGYSNSFAPFLSAPLAARVQSTDGTAALGLRSGPEGFGFQYTVGPLGADLLLPPRTGTSAFARGSYIEDGLAVALSVTWETYIAYRYDGMGSVASTLNGGGVGLDAGYYWPIALETGQGYIGPRLYSYVQCQSTNNAPLQCSGLRLNPGFGIGVSLSLGRFVAAPEISLFLLPPDEAYATPRLATPLSFSLSFRF